MNSWIRLRLLLLILVAGLLCPLGIKAEYIQSNQFWPTKGSGLTLNIGAGVSYCSYAMQSYAGGTLTMTASTTNYVYLDLTNSCTPSVNTTGFTATTIPIATVVTAAAITSVTDDRTWANQDNLFANGTFSTAAGAVGANTCASATTTTVSGVTTASVFVITPSADTNSLTGWGSTGGLVLDVWPTTNTLNVRICNQTGSSITASAATWNYVAINRALK
jgi:hypothetical protein